VSRAALRWLVPASLVAGLVLMIPFDRVVTRVLGVLCLLAFVAGGVFLIASPEFLGGDEERSSAP
jgi:hypothetical protein